jgi:DNA-binding NtrC family response regulator
MPNDVTKTDFETRGERDDLRRVPVLSIVHHPDSALLGKRCVLASGQSTALGRASDAFGAGALDQDRVSRQHAVVERVGEQVVIRDVGSRNGTAVNGEKISAARELQPGDVVTIGRMLFLYRPGPLSVGQLSSERLIGTSAERQALLQQIEGFATLPVNVLIQGETGVGKELVAEELHQRSGRRGRFVAINCGGLSDGVVHSELFGHSRGAFSGADREHRGLVETAAGGTLFLDEIGDATASLQASLLRLLEKREYRMVGSEQLQTTDARFVAATHVPLVEAVQSGRFRQDLHGRLDQCLIHVPPLRERPEDVMPLALHFAAAIAGAAATIHHKLALALLRAPWPNNVRQLRAVIEQAAVEAAGGDTLRLSPALEARLRALPAAANAASAPPAPAASGATLGRSGLDAEGLRARILAHRCNMSAVASELGVSRNTLYRWIHEAKIDVDALRAELR